MSAAAAPSTSIPASDELVPLTSSVDALPALCEDIASFLTSMSALSDPQKMATLESTVQGMLARLDEFGALASTIQNSTQQTKELSPDLLARAAELEALYVKIDRLEAYIAKMCEAMDALEDRQKEVKGVYGKNQVKKMFTSLMVCMSGSSKIVMG